MRYHGNIGFVTLIEKTPGVWDENVEEKEVFGVVERDHIKMKNSSYANADVDLDLQFRLVAANNMPKDLSSIRYITYRGAKWKVNSIDDLEYPHVILHVGGVYNGNEITVT